MGLVYSTNNTSENDVPNAEQNNNTNEISEVSLSAEVMKDVMDETLTLNDVQISDNTVAEIEVGSGVSETKTPNIITISDKAKLRLAYELIKANNSSIKSLEDELEMIKENRDYYRIKYNELLGKVRMVKDMVGIREPIDDSGIIQNIK